MLRVTIAVLLLSCSFSTASAQAASAHREVVRTIEAARDQVHRQHYRVTVDRSPARLPDEFSIHHAAQHVGHIPSMASISIRCRTGGCEGELINPSGVYRASVPRPVAESMAYRLYAYLTVSQTRRPQPGQIGTFGMSSRHASHMPYRTLELRSSTLEVRSEPWQPLQDDLAGHVDVRRFGHTAITEIIEAYARDVLSQSPVPVSPELHRYLRQVLASAVVPLDGVELALVPLAAHHLLQTQDRALLPALDRLGLESLSRRLDLETSGQNQHDALVRALCSTEYSRFSVAFQVLGEIPNEAQSVLRGALHCTQAAQPTWQILQRLSAGALVRRDYLRIRSLMLNHADATVRAHAAARLLNSRSRRLARSRLETVALAPLGEEIERERYVAIDALVRHTTETQARLLLGDRLAALTDTIPLSRHATYSGLPAFVEALGAIDGARYLPQLERLLGHSDRSLHVRVVQVIARVDQARALSVVRERIREFAEGRDPDASYRWNVSPYAALLRQWRATEVVPDLREVARQLRRAGADAAFREENAQLIRDLR